VPIPFFTIETNAGAVLIATPVLDGSPHRHYLALLEFAERFLARVPERVGPGARYASGPDRNTSIG
jgi:hypothetical protein